MDAPQIRLKARESLKGEYWYAVLAAFVASFFGALLVNGGTFDVDIKKDVAEMFGQLPKFIKLYLVVVGGIAGTVSFVSLILGGVIQLGYAGYLLKQHDREIHSVKDIFSQFDRFGQGFLQLLLRNIYTFLWGLLFLIPGIVKSFAYAMTPFIMAENPDMTAKEAIRLSKEKMDGHKGELFWLGLTFFGWSLLAPLTGGIGYIFLNPYMNAAYAAFYRDKISPKTAVTFTQPEVYIEQ
jgi:uncharacterized membrane protein